MLTRSQRKDLAARLVAHAYRQLFPDAQPYHFAIDDVRFELVIAVSQAPEESILPVIEQEVAKQLKAALPLRWMEMVPSNAADLLRSKGDEVMAEVLEEDEEGEATCSLVQMGESYYPCFEAEVESTEQIGAIKLTAIEIDERGEELKIQGMVAENPQALKALVKQKDRSQKVDHRLFALEQELSTGLEREDGTVAWILLPRGLSFQQLIREWWEGMQQQRGFVHVESAAYSLPVLTHRLMGAVGARWCEWRWEPLDGELFPSQKGLLDYPASAGDYSTTHIDQERLVETLTEILIFQQRLTEILGLKTEIYTDFTLPRESPKGVQWKKGIKALNKALEKAGIKLAEPPPYVEADLNGPTIRRRAFDAAGNGWELSRVTLTFSNEPELWLVEEVSFGSIPRLLALLLEAHEGALPPALAPVQVLVQLHDPEPLLIEEIEERLENEGVSYEFSSVGENIRIHEKMGIPYTCMLERGATLNDDLLVHKHGEKKARKSSFEDFVCEVIEAIDESLGAKENTLESK